MRQGGLILAAGRVRSKKKKFEKKKRKKICPTQNTPRNPQQPRDRVQLETACKETRPTHQPILSRFHRSRVGGNRPRTVLAISTSREVNEARWPHTYSRPCAFEKQKSKKKNTGKSAPPKTQHGIHSSPATACNSRRHAMKHVPRVSPYSPDSIDPGFV